MARINYEKEQKEYGLSVANIQYVQSYVGAILNGYLYQFPSELGDDSAILHTRVAANGAIDMMHTYADPNKQYGKMEWAFIDEKLNLKGKSMDADYISRVTAGYGKTQKEIVLEALENIIEKHPEFDVRMSKYIYDLTQTAKNEELSVSGPEMI